MECDTDWFIIPTATTVQINAGRVDISLKKEDPHKQWENIGTLLAGHGVSTAKSKRGEEKSIWVQ